MQENRQHEASSIYSASVAFPSRPVTPLYKPSVPRTSLSILSEVAEKASLDQRSFYMEV